MRLHNQHYTISASVEVMPPLAHFDIVYDPKCLSADDFYMARIFIVDSVDAASRSIALVDMLCAGCEPFAVLENHILTVILFESIVQIDLLTSRIIQHRHCGNMGGLHEIHAIESGYIIRGEGDIFRYDLDLNQIWHFMGRDILISPEKEKRFRIECGIIHCYDYLGWHYYLDMDGNLLDEVHEI